MSLQETTVSVNLAGSLNQEQDEFVRAAGTFSENENFVWDKEGRIKKRDGTETLPDVVTSSFPNPLSIGQSDIRSGIYSHKQQLLLQNKGALYSFDKQGQRWIFKGHHYPMGAKTEVEHANDLQISTPSLAKFGNYLIYTFVAYNGFTNTHSLRYRVYDTETDNLVVGEQVIDSIAAGVLTSPKILVFSNRVFISWVKTATIFITELSFPTGSFGSITALKTNVESHANSIGSVLSWSMTNQAGVGERAICVYPTSTTGTASIFSILNTGALDTTMGSLNLSNTGAVLSLYYSVQFSRLYLCSYLQVISSQGTVFAKIITFTSSGFTVVTTDTVKDYAIPLNIPNALVPSRAVFIDDSVNAGSVILFLNDREQVYYGSSTIPEPQDSIYFKRYSATASLSSLVIFSKNLSIFGEPIYRSDRNTIYLPCEFGSLTQGTLFLLDFYRGKVESGNPYAYVQAKTAYRTHVPSQGAYISPACQLSASVTLFASRIASRISGTDVDDLNPRNPGIAYLAGLGKTTYNFHPEYSASSAHLCGSTHLSGGYLGIYDGNEFCEHGFFLQPSSLEVRSPATTGRLTVAVTQQGGASQPEISRVTFQPAVLMNGFTSPGSYFTFNTGLTASVRVGYRIAGVGTIPTGATTNILVDLDGTEPAYEVLLKTSRALATVNIGQDVAANNILQLQTTTNVDVPDISVTNFTSAATGPGAGARSYAVVWSWIDNNGLQHRSAPAISTMASGDGTYPVAIVAYCATVTNRQVSSVRVEFYSTTVNGTTFYRIGSLEDLPAWNLNSGNIAYVTTINDTTLASGEILYTTGGVLPNSSVSACTALSTFKDRLLFSGMDRNTLGYSKTAQNNLPVEISEEMTLSTERDGQEIKAHGQLDDKLIVLKDQSLSAYAGDGANDLGTGVSFSQPISVASDVGSINQNSVAITPDGFWFRSKMGIQKITRGLEVVYPGSAVKDFNQFAVSKAEVLKDDKEVREIRFTLQDAPYTLVYNYIRGTWATFSNYAGDLSCLWQGVFTRVTSEGRVKVQKHGSFIDSGSTPATYNPRFVTSWMKVKNMQDFQRIKRMMLLGVLKSPHDLTVNIYYDYDSTNFDTYVFSSSNVAGTMPGDSVYEPEFHLKRQKCDAIQIEVIATPVGIDTTEECLTLTDMSFLVGIKKGLMKTKKAKKL